jgi:DNA (cytosine-5)-methyltransferase 1
VDTLNGLSLFTGLGGIDLALSEWVKPVAYCENDKYAQSVILSRMAEGQLPVAPIWDDVKTLKSSMFNIEIDIIYGGFPCQDVSVAGSGKGLEGERSRLFFEIIRLTDELKPSLIFLENVPAIRTRGLDRVLQEFTQRRYDCRWTMLQAAEVGAIHRRERWFLLAYSNMQRFNDNKSKTTRKDDTVRCKKCTTSFRNGGNINEIQKLSQNKISNTNNWSKRTQRFRQEKIYKIEEFSWCKDVRGVEDLRKRSDVPEPIICRKGDGISNSVERIKCLGNAVVPLQAKTAFKRLIGVK